MVDRTRGTTTHFEDFDQKNAFYILVQFQRLHILFGTFHLKPDTILINFFLVHFSTSHPEILGMSY